MGKTDDEGSTDPCAQDVAVDATAAVPLMTLPPVQTAAELPASAEGGTLCFVRDEGTSYLFADGVWSSSASHGED